MVSLSPEVLAKLMADGPVTLTPKEAAGVMRAAEPKTMPLNRRQRRALKKDKRRG